MPSLALAEEQPGIFYPFDFEFVVLEYWAWGSITPQDDLLTPRLRIYGDGRSVSYRPDYFQRPGSFEMVLARKEVDQLLQELEGYGLLEFDSQEVRRQMMALHGSPLADGSPRPRMIVTDAGRQEVHINLEHYSPPDGETPTDFQLMVDWGDLRGSIHNFPEIEALKGLQSSFDLLHDLAERVDSSVFVDQQ